MNINGKPWRTIWLEPDSRTVSIIDQTQLPHHFEIVRLTTADEAVLAIRNMLVRGAPLIGAAAAYGVFLGLLADSSDAGLGAVCAKLVQARPTAINLRWAVERMKTVLAPLPPQERLDAAREEAAMICEEDVRLNEALGKHGLRLIEEQYQRKGRPVNILTHCNAGWLATVDWGTALAPIFKAQQAGIPLHVWVDETRPRNQGAHLTAWELAAAGIDHHLIADNSGGHLMRQGQVDLCIVGTDRTTACGDVCNKIGTYLKALAAADNGVPFYVALPGSTIDWTLEDGLAIPIEERAEEEVLWVTGLTEDGQVRRVRIAPEQTRAANPAFDVTPARLVTGLITERGICAASKEGLLTLFPSQSLG
ncbi:S-methyl-5-thioribose-1-phosphate isomerase [Candidatus Electronema sp. PJ]|uniref:S-methyl-5-thioribose-1-phosphate isomerase n=1 Tax=Candidatus Electronema sp. PJ TaxID=3401572 RepID=UPI003AA9B0C3